MCYKMIVVIKVIWTLKLPILWLMVEAKKFYHFVIFYQHSIHKPIVGNAFALVCNWKIRDISQVSVRENIIIDNS